uniref:Retrotransposon gag domain-containing protein n=1 Tax=Oryzias sinensis TaxID=183150 RepID=A0A8C7X7T9_9TELE
MALLGISPPPAFLQNPGVPTILPESWIRMFKNYILALADKMEDKRKRALLIHTVGAETQRIFYTLPEMGDSYADVLQALKTFFIPKLNTVAERNKFRQRAQRVGESTAQYAGALPELVTTCDFGKLADDMIRDQIVEKNNNRRIRECLLMEDNLTLQKTLTLSAQIESSLAEAKAMATPACEAVVGMVQGTSTGSGRYRHGHF